MILKEFLEKFQVYGHYSTDRKLMSNNREGEVICYIALVDNSNDSSAVNWAVVFRGSKRKCLYAYINGHRIWDFRKAVAYIRKVKLEQLLPSEDFDKELMLNDL